MLLYFMCVALFILVLIIINSFNELTIREGFKNPKEEYTNQIAWIDNTITKINMGI